MPDFFVSYILGPKTWEREPNPKSQYNFLDYNPKNKV